MSDQPGPPSPAISPKDNDTLHWWMPGAPTAQRIGVFVAIVVGFCFVMAAVMYTFWRWRRNRRTSLPSMPAKQSEADGMATLCCNPTRSLRALFRQPQPPKQSMQLSAWPDWHSPASGAGHAGASREVGSSHNPWPFKESGSHARLLSPGSSEAGPNNAPAHTDSENGARAPGTPPARHEVRAAQLELPGDAGQASAPRAHLGSLDAPATFPVGSSAVAGTAAAMPAPHYQATAAMQHHSGSAVGAATAAPCVPARSIFESYRPEGDLESRLRAAVLGALGTGPGGTSPSVFERAAGQGRLPLPPAPPATEAAVVAAEASFGDLVSGAQSAHDASPTQGSSSVQATQAAAAAAGHRMHGAARPEAAQHAALGSPLSSGVLSPRSGALLLSSPFASSHQQALSGMQAPAPLPISHPHGTCVALDALAGHGLRPATVLAAASPGGPAPPAASLDGVWLHGSNSATAAAETPMLVSAADGGVAYEPQMLPYGSTPLRHAPSSGMTTPNITSPYASLLQPLAAPAASSFNQLTNPAFVMGSTELTSSAPVAQQHTDSSAPPGSWTPGTAASTWLGAAAPASATARQLVFDGSPWTQATAGDAPATAMAEAPAAEAEQGALSALEHSSTLDVQWGHDLSDPGISADAYHTSGTPAMAQQQPAQALSVVAAELLMTKNPLFTADGENKE